MFHMKQSLEERRKASERAKAYNKAHPEKARRAANKFTAKRFIMKQATSAELLEFRDIVGEALKSRQAEDEQLK